MKEIYPRYGRSAYSLGFLALLLGVWMGYMQWSEYFQTGRVIVSFSSARGPTYGPKFYLAFPLIEIVLGVICCGSGRIRVETSSESIAQFGLFGRLVAKIDWPNVTAFRREGQHAIAGDVTHRTVNEYAVEGGSQVVRFNEQLPRLSHLVREIRERLPLTAVNELPTPTNASSPNGSS